MGLCLYVAGPAPGEQPGHMGAGLRKMGVAALMCAAVVSAFAQSNSRSPSSAVPASCSLPGLTPGSQPSVPAMLAAYTSQARAVSSLRAVSEAVATAGARYGSQAAQPRSFAAYLLAERPSWIRMQVDTPVIARRVADLATDGREYRAFIPREGRFYIGPENGRPNSSNFIENVRLEPLHDALLWPDPSSDTMHALPDDPLAIEIDESDGRRRLHFDFAAGTLAWVEVRDGTSEILATAHYADWKTLAAQDGTAVCYPRSVSIEMPRQDYKLEFWFRRLGLNEGMPFARFQIEPPNGIGIVRLRNQAAAP